MVYQLLAPWHRTAAGEFLLLQPEQNETPVPIRMSGQAFMVAAPRIAASYDL